MLSLCRHTTFAVLFAVFIAVGGSHSLWAQEGGEDPFFALGKKQLAKLKTVRSEAYVSYQLGIYQKGKYLGRTTYRVLPSKIDKKEGYRIRQFIAYGRRDEKIQIEGDITCRSNLSPIQVKKVELVEKGGVVTRNVWTGKWKKGKLEVTHVRQTRRGKKELAKKSKTYTIDWKPGDLLEDTMPLLLLIINRDIPQTLEFRWIQMNGAKQRGRLTVTPKITLVQKKKKTLTNMVRIQASVEEKRWLTDRGIPLKVSFPGTTIEWHKVAPKNLGKDLTEIKEALPAPVEAVRRWIYALSRGDRKELAKLMDFEEMFDHYRRPAFSELPEKEQEKMRANFSNRLLKNLLSIEIQPLFPKESLLRFTSSNLSLVKDEGNDSRKVVLFRGVGSTRVYFRLHRIQNKWLIYAIQVRKK